MPGDVRLELAELVAVEPPRPRHAVRVCASLELAQAVELALVEGHDELPALDVRQRALRAVRPQQVDPAAAEAGLERPRRVVDPGVDDAAVAPRLVGRDLGLLLEHGDHGAGPGLAQPTRDREPDDPCADHPDALAGHVRRRSLPASCEAGRRTTRRVAASGARPVVQVDDAVVVRLAGGERTASPAPRPSGKRRGPEPARERIHEQVQLVDEAVGEHAPARACRCR